MLQFAGACQLCLQGEKLMMCATVEEHFYGTDELHFDACVLQPFAILGSIVTAPLTVSPSR